MVLRLGLTAATALVLLSGCGSEVLDDSIKEIEIQACVAEASQAVSEAEARELCVCTIDKLTETHGTIQDLTDAQIDVAVNECLMESATAAG